MPPGELATTVVGYGVLVLMGVLAHVRRRQADKRGDERASDVWFQVSVTVTVGICVIAVLS